MVSIFGHFVSIGTIFIALVELLLFVAAFATGNWLRLRESSVDVGAHVLSPALIFPLLMILTLAAVGHYQAADRESRSTMVSKIAIAWLLGVILSSLVFYSVPSTYVGRGVLLISSAVGFGLIVLIRLLFGSFLNASIMRRRVLVLGTGERAQMVDAAVARAGSAVSIVGFLPLNSTETMVDRNRILPAHMTVRQAMRGLGVTEIVVALNERRGGGLPVNDLLKCKLRGVRVTDFSSFFERERGQVLLDMLSASWLIFGEGFKRDFFKAALKRVFDILVASLILVLTLPLLCAVFLLIKLESPGPVFYSQVRVGRGGRNFTIYKLRSMRADAEKAGVPQWAKSNDDRITRVGRFIRLTRIDELPQLVNVLKGDMSVVGPRPERPYFVKMLTEEIPLYNARHSVKPGLTGWAQVRYPYGSSIGDAKEKLQYDLYYVKNHSIFLDLLILLETVQVVLWARGAR
jgi:sugar transferase (PEP-CTERM system associated)